MYYNVYNKRLFLISIIYSVLYTLLYLLVTVPKYEPLINQMIFQIILIWLFLPIAKILKSIFISITLFFDTKNRIYLSATLGIIFVPIVLIICAVASIYYAFNLPFLMYYLIEILSCFVLAGLFADLEARDGI